MRAKLTQMVIESWNTRGDAAVASGGQSANIASAMKNNIDQLYYPDAAAMAVFLIIAVLVPIVVILRIVDVRAELAR